MHTTLNNSIVVAVFISLVNIVSCFTQAQKALAEPLLEPPLFGSCVMNNDLCIMKCDDGGDIASPGRCLSKQQGYAEETLKDAYVELLALTKKFGKNLEADLITAQQEWEKYRKSNCQYHHNRRRTRDTYSLDRCMLIITRQRALELRHEISLLSYLDKG